jgi:hypothetical protein
MSFDAQITSTVHKASFHNLQVLGSHDCECPHHGNPGMKRRCHLVERVSQVASKQVSPKCRCLYTSSIVRGITSHRTFLEYLVVAIGSKNVLNGIKGENTVRNDFGVTGNRQLGSTTLLYRNHRENPI